MADALDSLRLMRTQERPAQVFVRGQGSWLWDSDGRAFLDFTQGLAVNCLGHSPSVLVQALARQARELVSAGPGLLNRPVLALAQRLCLATGSDQAYFLTSGAEANEAAIAMALIENIQREDLNPIEEAAALQRLQQEFQLTQQQVAEAVGKSRATITNLLRLIGLPEEIKTLLSHGDLEMGHARALLGLPAERQVEGARHVVAHGLTVRQTEALVRQWTHAPGKPAGPVKSDPDIARLEQRLAERLGASVQIRHGQKGKGQLVIRYSSLDELQGVLAHIR